MPSNTAPPSPDLAVAVRERYREVNGDHPVSAADDTYLRAHFATLDEVCAGRPETPAELRADMLAGRRPLPSYLRADGEPVVPPDYFALADTAGGLDRLHDWFTAQWTDRAHAETEWRDYLSGQYVCLRALTPAGIDRKDELIAAVRAALADPEPESPAWLARLHDLVDELDLLLADFTDYDRLRFGGPVSRDTCVDQPRARYPRT